MEIERKLIDSETLIIELKGVFNAVGANSVRPAFENIAAEKAPKKVLLDLLDVSFIDSSGIGAIVFLFKRLKDNKRELELIGVHGQVAELIQLLRLHKAITVELYNKQTLLCQA